MGIIKIKNTDLLKVSVEDLDGNFKISTTDRDISDNKFRQNILREKTFNNELSSLVKQIYDNENSSFASIEKEDKVNFTKEDNSCVKLEKETWQFENIKEFYQSLTSFYPFEVDGKNFEDVEDLESYLSEGISHSGFHTYSIMKYSISDSTYKIDIGNFDDSHKKNIIFSVKDYIFKILSEKPDGIILSADQIKKDTFLSKKFIQSSLVSNANSSYYMAKVSSIISIVAEKNNKFNISHMDHFFSPILIIEIEQGNYIQVKEILNKIKKNLAVPLEIYKLKNSINSEIINCNLENAVTMIDLFTKSKPETKFEWLLLTLSDYLTKDNTFILEYFLTSIKNRLNEKSFIFKIEIDRVIIVSTEDNIKEIYNFISSMNVYKENLINIETIEKNHIGDINTII